MNILTPTNWNSKKNREQRRRRPASVEFVLRNKAPGGQGLSRKISRLLELERLTQRYDGTLIRKKRSRKWRQSFSLVRAARA